MHDAEKEIAKAIYGWFDRPQGEDVDGDHYKAQPPYSFNEDPDTLTLMIDGPIDCKVLARHVYLQIISYLDDGAPRNTQI